MNFATAVLVIFVTTLFTNDVNATKKSKVCGTRNWPACALEQVNTTTSKYRILAENLSSKDNGGISFSLRVYRTECLTVRHINDTLKWYRLEALLVTNKSNTSTRIGTFIEPSESRRLETYACQKNSIIVFSTCEPHPLDLPRLYQWTAPEVNHTSDDVLCFRLTLQDADDQCKVTEVCKPMQDVVEKVMVSGSGEIDSGSGQDAVQPPPRSDTYGASSNHTQRCYERWDCSNSKMKQLCGSDGRTYPSRCHKRLQECLTDTDIGIEYPRPCEEEHPSVCHTQREILRRGGVRWLPTCDCDGLYKAKQCDIDHSDSNQLVCWCSYRNSISGVINTRRRIIDICSDPATFDFTCPSRWT